MRPQLKIDLTVPEKYSGKFRQEWSVQSYIDGNENAFNAKVAATEPGVSKDTRTLRVRAMVEGSEFGSKRGGYFH